MRYLRNARTLLLMQSSLIVAEAFFVGCRGPQSFEALYTNLTGGSYDPTLRPSQAMWKNTSKPAPAEQVEVQIYVTSIIDINQVAQTFTINGYFRTWWTDSRLAYKSAEDGFCYDVVHIPFDERSSIWQPDLYFDNAISVDYGADLLELYPNGNIWRSIRITATFSCTSMFFGRMPFDIQECGPVVASYSLNGYAVQLRTPPSGFLVFPSKEALNTPEFQLTGVSSKVKIYYFGSGDNIYPWYFLESDFVLRREAQFLILAVILPAIFFVMVAYVGFWVDRHMAPARVAAAVLPIIITITLQNTVYGYIPRISYGTWITDFLYYSLLFNCATPVEYAVVCLFMQKYDLVNSQLMEYLRSRKDVLQELLSDEEVKLMSEKYGSYYSSDDINSDFVANNPLNNVDQDADEMDVNCTSIAENEPGYRDGSSGDHEVSDDVEMRRSHGNSIWGLTDERPSHVYESQFTQMDAAEVSATDKEGSESKPSSKKMWKSKRESIMNSKVQFKKKHADEMGKLFALMWENQAQQQEKEERQMITRSGLLRSFRHLGIYITPQQINEVVRNVRHRQLEKYGVDDIHIRRTLMEYETQQDIDDLICLREYICLLCNVILYWAEIAPKPKAFHFQNMLQSDADTQPQRVVNLENLRADFYRSILISYNDYVTKPP